jgi:ferritin-like metal-binding protein YciE
MAMQKEASGHEQKMQELVDKVTESEGLDAQSIEQHAHETVEKAAEMMKTYLGEKPDTLAALEFLGLAEGGEVIHYEVLSKMAAEVKDKKFATGVRAILAEEQDHLKSCIRLAKQHSVAA